MPSTALATRALRLTRTAVLAAVAGLALAAPTALAQRDSADGGRNELRTEGRPLVSQGQDELPIRRITLYRSGVGSFERRGLVQGNAAVQLRFKTEQINDILKSMVALDLSRQGTVDGISYGSKEPLSRRLASFGVDISNNPTLGQLLAALRGTEVRVTFADATVEGVILGVETKMEPVTKDAPPVPVEYLNIVTSAGIRSIKLSLANSVELKDQALNAELGRALAAVAEYRADRTKTVDVHFAGEGARECVVAYVQEAPMWKTSYRLVLPDAQKSKDKAEPVKNDDRFTMQAWAIVENTTDEDWKDVTLSLVAGRPVSFRMDLYEPLYVFRPEIPVPMVPGVLPRQYAAGTDYTNAPEMDLQRTLGRPGDRARREAPAPAPASKAAGGQSPFRDNNAVAEVAEPLSAEDMTGYAARAQGGAVEAGEVFMYQVDHPVTVERQRSAMIPLLNAGIDGRRVSIFNPSDGGEHPMRGLEIRNTSNLQFMPGPISVFDGGAYAGDAQIGHVPAGDKRLLAYSVDLDVNVLRKDESHERIRRVKLVRGAFDITSLYQNAVSYTFTNKDKARDRLVVVEQPRLGGGWTLAQPKQPAEQTDTLYRFEVPVEATKASTIKIAQELISSRTIGVLSIDLPTLLAYQQQGNGVVSDAVIQAFREAQRLQSLVSQAQQRIADLESQRQAIDTDQNRIRQNMAAIDRTSTLYANYLKKLTEQETRVEQLANDLDKAREALRKAEADLNNYVAGLNVE
ncbi:MAG TPA: hypothetical protein VD997_01435 [Phycisphaerales bacterium]|nr:hypothetical protein [Phycisphaerales bacterium]